jgi:ATPase
MARVVKTMEQPRDLQVPKEITQYGALDRDMRWTGEVTLLVRPDHVIYDEVRTTEDFHTFADMRLAGVGLIGVTHANRAIDAVQRLIGRVDLGMIPQMVDTILFIDAGRIASVLELEFTVKVPHGMMVEDLARPVVTVKDVLGGQVLYELYTFGEQVVVMPVGSVEASKNPSDQLAEKELTRMLRRYVHGAMDIQVRNGRATVFVDEGEVPALIGKGGKTVQSLERKMGISLTIKPMQGAQRPGRERIRDERDARRQERRHAGRGADMVPRVRVKKTSTNVFLLVDGAEPGVYRVEVEGAVIGEAVASKEGRLRFKTESAEGQALVEAEKRGLVIDVVPAGP